MRYLIILAATLIPAAAAADIRMEESRYVNGVLRVEGRTSQPRQVVTLDGVYSQESDSSGNFVFHIDYLPRTCMVTLKAGSATHSALVANCLTRETSTTPPTR